MTMRITGVEAIAGAAGLDAPTGADAAGWLAASGSDATSGALAATGVDAGEVCTGVTALTTAFGADSPPHALKTSADTAASAVNRILIITSVLAPRTG